MTNRIVQLTDQEDNNIFPISIIPDNIARITMTDTDPGEGEPLAANNFIGVYGGPGYVNTDDIANGAVTTAKIGNAAVESANIDWGTFTFLSGSSTSIQLTAGKWIVIATLNVLTSVESGNFDSTISWIGKSLLFQGYRVSGQNRNQELFTFINILEPTETTTYAAARASGDQVNFHQSHWVAIKVSS